MRKLLLAGLFISASFFASAQISKGSTLLGGGVNYSNVKSDNSGINEVKQSNTSIILSAGKAVKENTIVGGSLSYGTFNTKTNNNNPPSESSSYGAGIFMRKYRTLGKNFYLFGQGDLSYGYGKTKQSQISSGTEIKNTSKGWNIIAGVTPGISYALSRKFQLELGFNNLVSVGYGSTKFSTTSPGNTTNSKHSSFNVSTNFGTTSSLTIGFRIFLAK